MELEALHSRLRLLNDLYLKVKEIITLAENINDGKFAYLAPINELRNALDHVMRSIQFPDRLDYEFDEAQEHIYRAGYDTFEILASNLGIKISDDLRPYSPTIISQIYPKYYEQQRPKILTIQTDLAHIRAHKTIDPTTRNKRFDNYFENVRELIEITKEVSSMIPEIENASKRIKREKIRDRIYTAIISLIVGILIGLSVWGITSAYKNSQNAGTSSQEKTNSK